MEFKVRGLTFEEMDKLYEEKGIDLIEGKKLNSHDTIRTILHMVFPDKATQKKLKSLSYGEILSLYNEVLEKTIGVTKKEKENL